ncbi:MAG: DUF4426 domain-containing protein [Gammaproteobacteria bacterium]
MTKRFFTGLTLLALGAALVACGDSEQVMMVGEPQPVQLKQHENYRDFGDYVVHFNALNTSDLPAEVARAYGIQRSDSRALLNFVILREEEGTTGVPVTGSVAVTATNLTGQLKTITMREIIEEDGNGIYYIGETPVTHRETLIYTIDVTPINEKSRFSAIYKKEFYTD